MRAIPGVTTWQLIPSLVAEIVNLVHCLIKKLGYIEVFQQELGYIEGKNNIEEIDGFKENGKNSMYQGIRYIKIRYMMLHCNSNNKYTKGNHNRSKFN